MTNYARPLEAVKKAKEQLVSAQGALIGLGSNVRYPLELALQHVEALTAALGKLQEEAVKKGRESLEIMAYGNAYTKQVAWIDMMMMRSLHPGVHDSFIVQRTKERPFKNEYCGSVQNHPADKAGHSAQHHGLQKHSVGGIYPWAIVGIGNGEKTHYEIHHLVTGEHICHRVRGAHETLSFDGAKAYSRAASCIERVLAEGIDSLNGGYIHTPTYRKS